MFGVDTNGIKKAFGDFNAEILSLPPCEDPWIKAIVRFIQSLGKKFT